MGIQEVRTQLSQGIYTEEVKLQANKLIPTLSTTERMSLLGLMVFAQDKQAETDRAQRKIRERKITGLEEEKKELEEKGEKKETRIRELETQITNEKNAIEKAGKAERESDQQKVNLQTQLTNCQRQVNELQRNGEIEKIREIYNTMIRFCEHQRAESQQLKWAFVAIVGLGWFNAWQEKGEESRYKRLTEKFKDTLQNFNRYSTYSFYSPAQAYKRANDEANFNYMDFVVSKRFLKKYSNWSQYDESHLSDNDEVVIYGPY